MRALVTGAGGFVGANLIRHLLATGHEPIAIVRPGGNRWRLAKLSGEVAVVDVNLRDGDAVQRLVADRRPEVVFHLAAYGAYSWQRDLASMLAVNVRATEDLLAGARDVGAVLVHAGSSSEYGFKDHPAREDEIVEPNSHYAVTKVAATHLCRLAAASEEARAVTLRLYSIYGPWEQPGRLIPALVQRCLEGGWPPLVGPETARDFVWVDDACEAFVRAATIEVPDRGAVFNIASGVQTTLRSLVEAAQGVFAPADAPTWGTMESRSWDTSTWVGDPTRASEQLDWCAATPITDGLGRMGAWLSDHPELAERYRG
ncbi:MAG: NAD-dependent epimerase/dehydratase family protein [Solirubrobacteraceae bacterium]